MTPTDDQRGHADGGPNRFEPLPDPKSLSDEELLALNTRLLEYLREIIRVRDERFPRRGDRSGKPDPGPDR
jgi:hypothetical protein